MAEEEEKPLAVRAKELARVVARDLGIKRKETKSRSPEIYVDEMEKSIDQIIAEEARAIWRKEERRRPPKELPQQYYDKAMVNILKRWQKTLKEIKETVPKMAPPPPPLDKAVVVAAPLCPICGEPMKRIVGRLYQCPKHPTQTKRLPEVPE